MIPTHEQCRRTWEVLPVDGVRYWDANDLLQKDDASLDAIVDEAAATRYGLAGIRNHGNKWVTGMHDGLVGRTILDYGCGIGIESRELLRRGNSVIVADINPASVQVAERVCGGSVTTAIIHAESPYVRGCTFDVFYCNGVLHHIPWAQDVLTWAASVLPDDGEMRLLLYTDFAREQAQSRAVPLGTAMDFGGVYADWYTEERLQSILPRGWHVARWEYIRTDNAYATAQIKKEMP